MKEHDELIEAVSAAVHDEWMRTKARQGVASVELMVPYDQLSEAAKDLDRGSVRAVLSGLSAAGYAVTPPAAGQGHPPLPEANL